jgi:hypothetical protein
MIHTQRVTYRPSVLTSYVLEFKHLEAEADSQAENPDDRAGRENREATDRKASAARGQGRTRLLMGHSGTLLDKNASEQSRHHTIEGLTAFASFTM